MSGRHIMVDAKCEMCRNIYQVRRTKFLAGNAKYCSKKCFDEVQKEEGMKCWGYENGKKYQEASGRWVVRWYDENGKAKTTSYPHWYYTINIGEVPDGFVVTYKDKDSKNIDPSNFILVSQKELSGDLCRSRIGWHQPESARKLISAVHKGKKLSDEHKNKIGERTKMLWSVGGVFDTQEVKEKIHKAKFGKPGNKASEESKRKMSISRLQYLSKPENKAKFLSSLLRGSDNHSWKGGLSKQKYPAEFSRGLRREVYGRCVGVCQICHVGVSTFDGRVHHIDANKNNNDISNLTLLCKTCHGAVHGTWKTNDPVILAFRSQLYQ